MNQIDAALYTKITGTAAITGLLASATAVFNHLAPQSTDEPYVVFGQQAAVPEFTFGGVAYETLTYMVKGVTKGPSGKVAGSIASQVDAALNDGTLTISGYSLMYCRRASAIDYVEAGPAGVVYHHRGALYDIWADPA